MTCVQRLIYCGSARRFVKAQKRSLSRAPIVFSAVSYAPRSSWTLQARCRYHSNIESFIGCWHLTVTTGPRES